MKGNNGIVGLVAWRKGKRGINDDNKRRKNKEDGKNFGKM